ncbi:hypothetical protein Droror1_Dr00019000 [Drosera rotundifolia]
MAADSPDSNHKHRRSTPDHDEPQEPSKRPKHKHRHHHRSNRRHRSSKNRDQESKGDEETATATANGDVVLDKIRVDYDMEEGEIVEEDVRIGERMVGSDLESGEIEGLKETEDLDMKDAMVWESKDTGNSRSVQDEALKSDLETKLSLDKDGHLRTQSSIDTDIFLAKEYLGRSRKVGIRASRRSDSPLTVGDNKKHHSDDEGAEGTLKIMVVDEGEVGQDIDSFSYGDDRESRYDTDSEVHGNSLERVSERSRSRRLHHVECLSSRHLDGDDAFNGNGKLENDSECDRVTHRTKGHNNGSRDSVKDKSERHSDHEDRHYSRKIRDNDMEETIERCDRMDRDEELKRAHRDQETGKDYYSDREQWAKSRDRGRGQSREPERDNAEERSRDSLHYRESDRDREREKKSRERDQEREKRRDSSKAVDRDRYAERDRERERERGRERDRERKRQMQKESDRERVKDREKEKGKERDKYEDRARDRRLDRISDGRSDRHGYRSRDVESDRSSRHHKYDDDGGGFEDRERNSDFNHRVHGATDDRRGRDRKHDSEKDHISEHNSAMSSEAKRNRDEDDQEDLLKRFELHSPEHEVNRVKEESRRLREAILQKYKNQQMKQQVRLDDTIEGNDLIAQSLESLATNDDLTQNLDKSEVQDPDVADIFFSVGKSPHEIDASAAEKGSAAGGLGEGTPKSERSSDMFCDDIFGDSPAGVRKLGKAGDLRVERSGLHDNWDDAEGYYSYRFGEVLDGRYEITAAHGKGVFSIVVRAKDLRAGSGDPEEVAVKIIRNNETMLKAGMEELVILKKLVGADPDDRRHCVRFLSSFKYRNHLCLVFESLHMNLREVLKKFGRNIGLKLTAVRTYAKQLFIALKHLRNCGILHCDIKPDNMLVNDAKTVLKICDFGNAMFAGKNEITPYLVSRFYRAPEIILGLPYDHPMDMWSVGCCLYELYTGKVLFPGPSNNDMLRLHMELKGSFPKKMLRKGAFVDQHFDQDLNFLAIEEDPVTKKAVKRLMVNIKPKDIGTIIKGFSGEEPKMLANFKDLLDKIFILDPDKRLTVSQALSHPFITGK